MKEDPIIYSNKNFWKQVVIAKFLSERKKKLYRVQTKFVGGGGVTKTIAKKRILGFNSIIYPQLSTRTKKSQLLFLRISENKNSETNIAQHSTKKKKKKHYFRGLFKRWTKLNNSVLPYSKTPALSFYSESNSNTW